MGVYDRNKNYADRKPNLWISYTVDEATRVKFALKDRKVREPANCTDKRAAQQLLTLRRREIRDGTWRPPAEGGSAKKTVTQYAEPWVAARKRDGVKSANKDKHRLERFILPALGTMPLDEVKRDHVKALMAEVAKAPKLRRYQGKLVVTEQTITPREVHHVYGVIRGIFRSALEEELVLRTPCTLRIKKGELPKKKDPDPRWRSNAVFTREEMELLMSDERVPLQRRVLYCLLFLTFTRIGETVGRQWRDYDGVAKPLGRLSVPTQYEDEETKTEVPREVPVHPVLAAVLAAWRLEGFPFFFGRKPRPDDYIVPKLRGKGPQSEKRVWHNLQIDLRKLGLRPRRVHDVRRTSISLAIADDANDYLLQWITHGPREGTAFNLYNTPPWAKLCAEVAKLQLGLRGASVTAISARDKRTLKRSTRWKDSANESVAEGI